MARYAWSNKHHRDRTNEIEPIFEVAQVWKNTCLIADGSMLFSEHAVWTKENFEELHVVTRASPIIDERDFFGRLEEQLEKSSDDIVRLAAELFWVMWLAPLGIIETKIQDVRRIASWRELTVNEAMLRYSFGETYEREAGHNWAGIGDVRPGYLLHRWEEWCMALGLFWEIKKCSRDDRSKLLNAEYGLTTLYNRFGWKTIWTGIELREPQFRHMVNYILFPEEQERVFSKDHREKIIMKFGKWHSKMRHLEINKQLQSIRKNLENNPSIREEQQANGASRMDWYQSWIASKWNK